MADNSAAETGRLLLDHLQISDDGARSNGSKSLKKRQISAGTYATNTKYDPKLMRVSFLGARKPGVVPNMWSQTEDEALRAAVKKHGERNWRLIAEDIPGRNHLQCLQRWKKALRPGLVKGHWSKEEDSKLLGLIKSYTDSKGSIGSINWASIAAQIDGRNAKQCRERWFLNLDPSINRGPWTAAEDQRLLELAAQCGGRWSLIAKNMDGRTENSVKTRFHSLQRQQARARGWTQEEDDALINATLVFGRDWTKIVKQMPGRVKGQLKKRFNTLTQHRPDLIRRVQALEDQIAQGAIVPPNPPPPPIQPLGTHYVQKPNNFAPAAQQTQAKLSKRAPVPPPPTAFTAPPPQPQQQQWVMPPQQQQQQQQWAMPQQAPNAPPPPPAGQPPKGMRKYGSSWMAGIVDNLDGNSNAPPPPTLGGDMFAGVAPPIVDKNLARTNSQNVLNDYIATQGGEVGTKGLARQETSNLALLDKLLSDGGLAAGALGGEVGAPDFASPNGERSKGLKNYSSWGSIGGGDFGANLFGTDTTAGNSGAPTVMRTGSSKQMKKMSSSNWGGATKGLGTYDSGTDIKNILNML